MIKKIVTLYIDDASVRLLVTTGKRIKKWAELPLEPGLVKGGVVIKEAEVAAQIKQLLQVNKVKANKVIIGVSGLHCLTRPIALPQLPKAMLAEAVMREAQRVLPVPLEQFYTLWQTIPAPAGKIQVFLAAIPCKTADALLKMLHQIGLNPYLMDLKPLALARVVRETTAIIVDVQPTEFDIVIMADGVPQPIRTIPFPSEKLSRQEKLPMIRADLARTIEFYNSNNPERSLVSSVPVFVSGELADEPELRQSLEDGLGYSVLPLLSPLKCPQQIDPSQYMANIGLALKKLSGKEAGPLVANLNVLPTTYRPKPPSLTKIVALPGAATVIGLLVPLTMIIQGTSDSIALTRSQLDITNQLLNQNQQERQELLKNIAELEEKVAEVKASPDNFSTALDSLDRQRDTFNGDLEETTNAAPSTISLINISYSENVLTIIGSTSTEAEVLSYARSLEASGRFSEIIITSIKRNEDAETNFSLILRAGGQD
ncbi:pilus assembly protein PilM [Chloroflexota bacterium]